MSAAPIQILLVDDNGDDVYLLTKALEGVALNFELTVLSDGAEALSFVAREGKYAGRFVPDLVIMDLNLPKNDGIEVLQLVRQTDDLRRVPVVVTSSSASPREQAKVERLGLERYVPKPSNLDDFLELGSVFKQILVQSDILATDKAK